MNKVSKTTSKTPSSVRPSMDGAKFKKTLLIGEKGVSIINQVSSSARISAVSSNNEVAKKRGMNLFKTQNM